MHLKSIPKFITKTRERILNRIEETRPRTKSLTSYVESSGNCSAPALPASSSNLDGYLDRKRSASYIPLTGTVHVHVPRIVVPSHTELSRPKSVFVEHFDDNDFDYQLAGLITPPPPPPPPPSASDEIVTRIPENPTTLVRRPTRVAKSQPTADKVNSTKDERDTESVVIGEASAALLTKPRPIFSPEKTTTQVRRSNAVSRARGRVPSESL